MDASEAPVGPVETPVKRPSQHQVASWILLALVVFAIIAAQFSSYVSQGGKEGEAVTWAAEQTQAEAMLWMAELSKEANPASYKQAREGLVKQWKERENEASGSAEGAKTWVPVAYELGIPIPDQAVEKLKELKDDSALYDLYSGKPTAETLASLREAEPDFPHRLAAYHASKSVGDPVPASSVFQQARMIALFVVFGGFVVVLSVGAVSLVVFFTLAKRLPQVGYPPRGLTHDVSDRFAFRMALYLIAYFGGVIAILSSVPLALPLMVRAMIGMGLFVFVLLGLLAIPFGGVKDSIRGLIGRTDRPWRLVGAGLWAWLAVTPLVLLFALVMTQVFSWLPTPSHPTTVDIAGGSNMLDIFATYAVAAVLAPFLEELTFRGLLFPALKRWMSWFAAAALSGLVFAAVHPQGPLLWLSLGSIGAASALVAQYTGSLVPSFVLHAANNAAVLTLAMVVFG